MINPQTQKISASQAQAKKQEENVTKRHYIIKFLKNQWYRKNFEGNKRKKDTLWTEEKNLWVTVDILLEATQAIKSQKTMEQCP